MQTITTIGLDIAKSAAGRDRAAVRQEVENLQKQSTELKPLLAFMPNEMSAPSCF
jgi:hypothetical protein